MPPGPALAVRASASVTVLTFEELTRQLRALQPPPAYRLSLDSGVEYKNVRQALANPHATRLETWRKLLHSMRIRMVAARCVEDVIWPGEQTLLIGFGNEASALVEPRRTLSLREWRLRAGWSRRALARHAGVAVDTVTSVEDGRGMLCKLARLCHPLGLQLLLALPPAHDCLESLWRERAPRCLDEPAQYPRPQRRKLRNRRGALGG